MHVSRRSGAGTERDLLAAWVIEPTHEAARAYGDQCPRKKSESDARMGRVFGLRRPNLIAAASFDLHEVDAMHA